MTNYQSLQTWRKVKLGEVAGVLGGFAFKSEWFNTRKIGFPSVKIQNISDGSVDIKNAEYVDVAKVKRDISKFKLHKGDFLVAMTGATSGKVGLLAEKTPCYLNQRVGKFYVKDKNVLGEKFLYYSVINPRNLNLLKKLADGSAQGNMSSSQIEDVLEIFLPDGITVQKHIVDILSAFDDKIELNNKISTALEQMAQVIFKEWFVNFHFPGHENVKMVDSELGKIPEGWEVKKLGDVADVQWGDTSITKLSYVKEGYPAYSASGQDGFRNKYNFDRVGIVLSAIGNCGITWLARNKWSVIKNTIRFWSIDGKISTEYLYLATRGQKTWPQRGSAQPFIALGDARKRKILIPAENIFKQFNDFIVGAYSKIDTMRLENQKLAAFRDLLLPKLISGEISIGTDYKDTLFAYLDKLCKETKDDRLVDEKVRSKIIDLVRDGSGITNLIPSDLLPRLDFKPKDLTIEALESFLAELWSILWLRDFGFVNITPIEARKNTQPDFTAKYRGKTCAVEVFCLTQVHEQQKDPSLNVYKNFDPNFEGSKFGRDFMSKAPNKKMQLDSMKADMKILLCVVNSQPMIRLNTKTDFEEYTKLFYEKLAWGDGYYLGILTGVHANGIPSDIIFPKLPI